MGNFKKGIKLTPHEIEASYVDKQTGDERGYYKDDEEKAVQNVVLGRIHGVFIHEKCTVGGGERELKL